MTDDQHPSLTTSARSGSDPHLPSAAAAQHPPSHHPAPSSPLLPSPQQQHHPPHHHPQIRHSGRAQVRGKIRRVWRPRYLELWGDGSGTSTGGCVATTDAVVRYYELPPDSDPGVEDSLHLHLTPKYMLKVYAARILDVTTLRDMHVGLPQGSYGFVFRGQRLVHLEEKEELPPTTTTTTRTAPAVVVVTPPRQHSQQHRREGNDPDGTSVAEEDEANATVEDLLTARRTNASALSSSTTAVSSLLLNNLQCGGGGPEGGHEPRDFLCAVQTLEEAQMWVVALQWAAEQTHQGGGGMMMAAPAAATATAIPPSLPTEPWWEVEADEWVGAVSASALPDRRTTNDSASLRGLRHRARTASSQEAGELVGPTNPSVSSSRPRAATAPPPEAPPDPSPHSPQQPASAPPAPTKPGKVVVARVVDYRLVRVAISSPPPSSSTGLPVATPTPFARWRTLLVGWHWEVAYEIHALLIQNRHVEQLVLWRTANDVSRLLQALASPAAPSFSDSASASGTSPPSRLIRLCQQLPSHPDRWVENVSIVDSIVRSLVLDATAVNTAAMKEFLGLTAAAAPGTNRTTASAAGEASHCRGIPALWHLHDRRGLASHTTATLPATAEDYVRQWLQERNHRSPSSSVTPRSRSWDVWLYTACQTCVNPRQVLAAVGLSVLVPCAAVRLWQCLPSRVTLRWDALLGSWAAAAYLGRAYERSQASRQSSARGIPVRRTSKRKLGRDTARASGAPEEHPSAPLLGAPDRIGDGRLTLVPDDAGEDEEDANAGVDESEESDGEDLTTDEGYLSEAASEKLLGSPLPEFPANHGLSCWSKPRDDIFHVRGPSYLQDRVKIPSEPGPLSCRGVDVWMSDNPERHIARHPSVLGGRLGEVDTFLVNFLLPFGNFVAYFSIPPLDQFPSKLRSVWTNFLKGDQQYRDARLKLLPVVVDGPWIVKTAVGGGKSPALLGKAIPLQYFFRDPDEDTKGVYEVDVIITASTIAKGILSVVKGHTKSVSIAFAFIIEASEVEDLPETVLCSFQVHSLYLEDCPLLPPCNLDETAHSN